ncbi:hypothetical protein K227x_45950 [Rubripirellula lacrimiformis]|uniref:Uncharacterized protein n=1 Tax=Rubripirellula lacrimiformis TaxID=1930273 RepID=A0A517NGC2_9BACT|nr:hypothetical protein K227x_45950 [Rubripirellula lacrimiformis]
MRGGKFEFEFEFESCHSSASPLPRIGREFYSCPMWGRGAGGEGGKFEFEFEFKFKFKSYHSSASSLPRIGREFCSCPMWGRGAGGEGGKVRVRVQVQELPQLRLLSPPHRTRVLLVSDVGERGRG